MRAVNTIVLSQKVWQNVTGERRTGVTRASAAVSPSPWVCMPVRHALTKLYFHLLSNWMGYDRGDSFFFRGDPNGIPLGSKSKGKLSPRYRIHFERNWKYCFLSVGLHACPTPNSSSLWVFPCGWNITQNNTHLKGLCDSPTCFRPTFFVQSC